jgi:glycogen operon protein
MATRLAGSFDIFDGAPKTRTVNFVAAHDGKTLADLNRYEARHNEANGEENRDGHAENLSWNNGVEGDSDAPDVSWARARDVRALLGILFASRGTIMLTAGDEFGRTQRGNNNAYAQDNEVTWLDWAGRDRALERHVFALSAMRRAMPALRETSFLTGKPLKRSTFPDVEWLTETGLPFEETHWHEPERRRLSLVLAGGEGARFAVLVNGDRRACVFTLPERPGYAWAPVPGEEPAPVDPSRPVPGRTVVFLMEEKLAANRGRESGKT